MTAPRRLRWALHAFPRRFRAQRRAEIESTFHEAELAGDPEAYGTTALVDVALAGWRERARTRPPLGQYLKYRLFGGRLDLRWHAWLFDDLDGWFPARRAAWAVSLLVLTWAAVWRVADGTFTLPPSPIWLGWLIAWTSTAGLERRRTLERHGYDPRTRAWRPPVVVNWVPAPRRIPRAVPVLTGVATALLVVAPFAAVTMWFPDHTIRSVTIGEFSFVRTVDHSVGVGWIAFFVGCILLAAGLATRTSIARRVLVPADTVNPIDVVVTPSGRAGWLSFLVVVVGGIATSAVPIVPIVPAVSLAAGIASPVLLALALGARRHEQRTSAPVGLRTARHTARQRATHP